MQRTMRRNSLYALIWLIGLAAPAFAGCEVTEFENHPYTICDVGLDADMRLFLNDADGDILGSFGAVNAALLDEGKQLAFAMNAGMYHKDRSPVGLYVEKNQQVAPLTHGGGYGNFGLTPNGIFCIQPESLRVIETKAFEASPPKCAFATQSGPMLVINGALHPKLIPDGSSKYYRNGVGTNAAGTRAYFAISDRRVNFHDFARLFRDHLGLENALFLDGKISRLYAPELSRSDLGLALGPIVGLVVDR
jgi:uncharacterized protein YigE (DUF2233 family)